MRAVDLEACYDIHGVGLRFRTNDPGILEAVNRLMFPFSAEADIADGGELKFRLASVGGVGEIPPSAGPRGEILYRSSGEDAFDLRRLYGIDLACRFDGRVTHWDFGSGGSVACRPHEGEAEGYIVRRSTPSETLISHWFFLPGLHDMLRARGLFSIHAAGVSRGGRGVLMVGLSGSGKTTSCLALALGGFDFLSDDRSFIRRDGDGWEMLGFPEGVDVTDATAGLFPELAAHLGERKGGSGKRTFLMTELERARVVPNAAPRLLLFPQVRAEASTEIKPAPKAWALRQLLPQSLLVFDPKLSSEHFQALASLVEGSRTYRLHAGRDIHRLPSLIEALLDSE